MQCEKSPRRFLQEDGYIQIILFLEIQHLKAYKNHLLY